MPDSPSTEPPLAVMGLGGGTLDILAHIPGSDGAALLLAYEPAGGNEPTQLRVLQSVTACRVRLTVNVSSVQSATTAHGSLYFVAAAHSTPGALRLWKVSQASLASGLCGAIVPVAQVGTVILRSHLTVCGNAMTFVAATDVDNSVRLWGIDAHGLASSHPLSVASVAAVSNGALPGLPCMWQSASVVLLPSGIMDVTSNEDGFIAIISPAPNAQYTSPRALTVVGDRLCFLASDASAVADHRALFCWTHAGGVVRLDGATVPDSVGWMMPGTSGRVFTPCTLAGTPLGAPPHACVYDFQSASWRPIVDGASGTPVGAPYSSFTVAGTSTYFAGKQTGAGSVALWQIE